MDQVRCARDLSYVPVVLEVVAREVFEDMLHRGNQPAWDKKITFKAPRVSTTNANELFDEKPLAKVIWDEELLDSWDSHSLQEQVVQEMDNQMQCKQGDITVPVLSECEDHMVFDLVPPATVVWDEDVHSMHDHDGLLQQLALGRDKFVSEVEDMASAKQKQVHIQLSVGKDDKSIHNIDSQDSLLQQLAQGVIEDRHHKAIQWDVELEQDQSSHGDLLQLLANGGKYSGEECPEQVVEEVLTHVNGPSLLLEHGMNSVQDDSGEYLDADEWKATAQLFINGGFSEMPSIDVVWDDDLLENDESQDNLFMLVADGECLDRVDSNSIVKLENFNILTVTKNDGANMLEGLMASSFCSQGSKWMKLQPYMEQEGSFTGQNTFSPGNCDLEFAHLFFDKTLPWRRNGFSPGKGENKHARWSTNRQWDPGIIQFIMQEIDGEGKCRTKSYLWIRCCETVQGVLGYDDSLGTSYVSRGR